MEDWKSLTRVEINPRQSARTKFCRNLYKFSKNITVSFLESLDCQCHARARTIHVDGTAIGLVLRNQRGRRRMDGNHCTQRQKTLLSTQTLNSTMEVHKRPKVEHEHDIIFRRVLKRKKQSNTKDMPDRWKLYYQVRSMSTVDKISIEPCRSITKSPNDIFIISDDYFLRYHQHYSSTLTL